MKFTIGTLIFIVAFMLYYLILSLIGSIFVGSFKATVTDSDWFFIYSLMLGWWLATGTMMETLERYFKD